MKKVAVYPGTFDPITFGHIDVIKKALKLFDKVVIAASEGTNKNYLFNSLERIQLIKKALFIDLKFEKKKILNLRKDLFYLLQKMDTGKKLWTMNIELQIEVVRA